MGWARMLFLGNVGQQMDIEEQRTRVDTLAERNARERETLQRQVISLRDEVARLKLLSVALSRTLVAKGVISDRDLNAMIEEVDLLDGKRDGRSDGPAAVTVPEGVKVRFDPVRRVFY